MESTARTVRADDGARIAVARSGAGPPLVLVHGGWDDHTAWAAVIPALAQRFTVHAMDRRGCGRSAPYGAHHTIERDVADVAAVVDSAGESVHLVGHSIGALCALHAALLTPRVRRLVLYEPPLGGPEVAPAAAVDRIAALVAAGNRDAAAVVFVHEVVGLPMATVERLRASPGWPLRVAGVHAVPDGMRALRRFCFDGTRLGALTTPTLLLVGSDSTPYHKRATELIAAALLDARMVVLPDQQHNANLTAPDVLAAEILRFLTA